MFFISFTCFGAENIRDNLKWKWVYVPCNFGIGDSVAQVKRIIIQAKEAGYNGIVLADTKFDSVKKQPVSYLLRLKLIKDFADSYDIEIIPRIFNVGYANSLLANDVNMAEAMPVIDAIVEVKSGMANLADTSNVLADCLITRNNKNFQGWTYVDAFNESLFFDEQVFHSDGASARFENIHNAKYGQCRMVKKLKLKPWTLYRFSVWVKTEGVDLPNKIATYIFDNDDKVIESFTINAKTAQDWTKYEVVFNSQDDANVSIYVGGWGIKQGKFWIDDVSLSQCLGINLIRRKGCPVKISELNGKTVYSEEVDYNQWVFDKLGKKTNPGVYHTTYNDISIVIPEGSTIKNGQKLKVSYYFVPVVGGSQVGICFSYDNFYSILTEQYKQIYKILLPEKVFFGWDEVRISGYCGLCRNSGKTSGQLLDDCMQKCEKIIGRENSNTRIFVWGDMFDPFSNAGVKNYYYTTGFAKSWEGLPRNVGIVNWNYDKSKESLNFFNKNGYRQLIAGYYDRDYKKELQVWSESLKNLKGPKVEGVMYTSWKNDYSDLNDFLRLAEKVLQ